MDNTTTLIDPYDRILGNLTGLNDVTHTRPTTVTTLTPIVGFAQTFVVQTYRQREQGDTIFLQYIDAAGSRRIVIPPEVADVIARQRDALTGKVRSKVARAIADDRKARGIVSGFAAMTPAERKILQAKAKGTRAANAAARRLARLHAKAARKAAKKG